MNDLFTTQESAERDAARERVIRLGWEMWGWDGPTAGGLCEVGRPIVDTPEGQPLYCYCEQVRLIEQKADGRWLAEIAMGDVYGKPWHKDGRRVLLTRDEISAPTRLIRSQRRAA